eukprot:GFUD01000706.1.p1 GENE.GFUD01000706.1~~GFUD01000706.1.p1  ORF type:complete len:1627 (+),score=503.34 GFUD01000706.1:566-5446(+)
MANICNQTNGIEPEEDEESEYSYVYETESEYEYEDEEEEKKAVQSNTNNLMTVEITEDNETNPPLESPVDGDLLEDDENTALQKHKEQLEKFKPKLPAYITTPEPCAFSEDPSRWISWMEDEVNKEKDRRMQKILEVESSHDLPEVETEPSGNEGGRCSAKMEIDPSMHEENFAMKQDQCENKIGIEENANDNDTNEINETVNMQISTESDIDNNVDNDEDDMHIDTDNIENKCDNEIDCEEDNGDEWEYEYEDEEGCEGVELNVPGSNDSGELCENSPDSAAKTEDNDPHDVPAKSESNVIPVNEGLAHSVDGMHQLECSDTNHPSNEEKTEAFTERRTYNKQMSLPAGKSSVPDDIQQKLDFIRQKKASHGQLTGENPNNSPTTTDPNSCLDSETQRKLAFVRQKRAEAAAKAISTDETEDSNERVNPVKDISNDETEDNTEQLTPSHSSTDPLDAETRRKLEFIRKKKKASAPCLTNDDKEKVEHPALARQQSNPEGRARPNSFAAQYGDDSNLDDMLARIKILRSERKQILEDMNAIKNAFDGPSVKMPESAEEIMDDGIETGSTGESTPSHEMHSPFKVDSNGKSSPSICPSSALSRQARRSIDSGIGSKSLCSIQDGSPTAELEAISEKGAMSSSFSSEGHGRKKINNDEKEAIEGEVYCFICGESLGKLTKGAVMHMGLEDGDPVCADALYLTEESKEKIRNIASTRMFTYEAKYELLETIDLETWDIDYDIPAGDVMDKVDAFLQDVELQKQRDEVKFEEMRNGAIDEIFMEEFREMLSQKHSNDEEFKTTFDAESAVDMNESDTYAVNRHSAPPRPPPPQMSNGGPPPPPPPPTGNASKTLSNIPQPQPALANVLKSIKEGVPQLKHIETSDHSEIKVGQVIHKHIAPIVFTKDIRCLVKDISNDDHKRLKKVKTNDKSAPFIPDDVEIYFYGGQNSNKAAPPPPLSTKIKEEINSSKKRANAGMDNSVTPVYLAAQEGHLDVLKYLVKESGGDLFARAQDGMAPIHASAQMGCLNCLKWMVQDQSVDINILDGDEATPLHFAASRGHTDTVRWLLRHGARITHDKYGKTPMNDAAENKQLEVLSLLVQHSGDDVKSWGSKSEDDPCSCTSSKSSTGSKDPEPFYLHPPNDDRSRRKREGVSSASEESDHQYEAITEDTIMKDGEGRQRLGNGYSENGHSKLARVCAANAPPPPPLPPPDLMTPAAPRRLVERRNSTDSMNSLNTLLSAEFGKIDNEGDDGEVHVLKPSELAKGKKRKNVPKEDGSDEVDNDDDFVPLAPKPGAHMVLPFIPPKFSSLNREGNSLIKPSEYLKSLNSRGSLPRGPVGIPDFGQYDETSSQSSCESGIDSPGSSLPSSGVSPPLPATQLPVIKEDDDVVAWSEGVPPPPPPPPGGVPPPPPPPPHPTLKATQSAPATIQQNTLESKSSTPQASMAISMKDLQSVQLKKTEAGGGRQNLEKTVSDPLAKLLIPNSKKGFGGETKGDLIAELKLSHTIGGVGKLRSEQHKAQEEAEKEQYRKFLGQFTTENFLKKIPSTDPAGNEIPKWKREMLAKKAAEKAKQESLDERARIEEERKMQAIPAWKRQLMAQKDGDTVKRVAKQKKDREKERKKKLIMKL